MAFSPLTTCLGQSETPPPVQRPSNPARQGQVESIRERLNQQLREGQSQPRDASQLDIPNILQTRPTPNATTSEPLESDPNAPFLEQDILTLSDVIASTYRGFPLIEIARQQAGVTSGEYRSAWGAYDTKLEYFSLNQPMGYYETYRNGIGAARQLWWGGYLSAGYRIGRGYYEPWYKERQTDDGGEFKLAYQQPLLQGRAIDPQRVELFQANLRRQSVGPEIQFQLLVATRDAAFAYWHWVEQGNVLRAQQNLLRLAELRADQFEEALKQGVATALTVSLNRQEILSRQLKVNDTQMKFRDAAYKLSIFLRDENGKPLLAPQEWLPPRFPKPVDIQLATYEQDYSNAIAARPELRLIELQAQEVRLDLQLARNQLLPNVDFTMQAGKDIGEPATSTNDKREFELESGIVGGVPIQRNKAFGKIQSTNAKLVQIAQKLEFQRNKINAELLMARNQVEIAQRNVKVAQEFLLETQKVLELFRLAVTQGDFDLQLFLQQEVRVTEAEVRLLEEVRTYYLAIAALQATLGLDPLDQSTLLNTTSVYQ